MSDRKTDEDTVPTDRRTLLRRASGAVLGGVGIAAVSGSAGAREDDTYHGGMTSSLSEAEAQSKADRLRSIEEPVETVEITAVAQNPCKEVDLPGVPASIEGCLTESGVSVTTSVWGVTITSHGIENGDTITADGGIPAPPNPLGVSWIKIHEEYSVPDATTLELDIDLEFCWADWCGFVPCLDCTEVSAVDETINF